MSRASKRGVRSLRGILRRSRSEEAGEKCLVKRRKFQVRSARGLNGAADWSEENGEKNTNGRGRKVSDDPVAKKVTCKRGGLFLED